MKTEHIDDPFERFTGVKSAVPRSGLIIPPPWATEGSDRSVRAGGNITGAVVTGDQNTVTTHVTLPPAETVNPQAELAALRALLAPLTIPERAKCDRAFADAEDEFAKPKPDKEELAGALQRVIKTAKGANAFADQVEKLAPHVTALAAWLGQIGHPLLALAGLGT